jgi:three-Cys-motif partner protein
MVALRRLPRDLPPPLDDGRPTRSVHSYDGVKMHLWGGIVNASAMAMKNKWPGRRACIDLFASYGLNRVDDSGELCWGSSLLALHADAGFDTYIFCDRNPKATKVLCERIADPIYFGLPVFDLDIGSESAGARVAEIKGAVTSGPKVIVLTGDANAAPVFIRALMPAWEHNRYALALIDPPSLSFWWESLEALTFNERMDLMLLFAEGMDLNRNLERYAAQETSKLDRFIGATDWRDLLTERRPTIALREHYKARMKKYLGYEAFGAYDRPVRNQKNAELYKLIYASKIKLGSELWDKANKDEPDGQISLIV